jgi:hypothetical protein
VTYARVREAPELLDRRHVADAKPPVPGSKAEAIGRRMIRIACGAPALPRYHAQLN